MGNVNVIVEEKVATLRMDRGKVNALDGELIAELRCRFEALEKDENIAATVIAGKGKFFSFGFDIPVFLSFSREQFTEFLMEFTSFYTYLFSYPKPVVAALNGHAIAGGCMMALACDRRLMIEGKAKISLNEIGFGSNVFAGSTEMLRFWVGNSNATEILYSGNMYSAREAKSLGMVDEVFDEKLLSRAREVATSLGSKYFTAFASIKSLLRKPIVEEMVRSEKDSVRELVSIWYSDATRKNLERIKIR